MFRVNGKPAIGLAIAMRDGGDILTLGRNVKKAIDDSVANLPLGIDASLVSDQPVVVQTAIGEFMELLWQAIAIIMAVSIISLGLRPGLGGGADDSAHDRDRVSDHAGDAYRPPAHLARRAHHFVEPARRQRHDRRST